MRGLGLNCPDAFGQAVPAEGVVPNAEAKSHGELPARAGAPESLIVPLETEDVSNTEAELARVRDHMMTHHPKDQSCEACVKIQRRQKRKKFRKADDESFDQA